MDFNKISQLSDEQLISLYRNPSTTKEIKKALLKELTLRELNDLKSETPNQEIELTQNQKWQLICLPFLYSKHRKNMFKGTWSRKRDRQFWNYITLGIAVYSILLMVALLFRNH